ncbi:MAG: hypothetical protein J0L61_02220 [Planctomycetes bacterium]|nr:hypothetical protein [Planctomycetota bacterium]
MNCSAVGVCAFTVWLFVNPTRTANPGWTPSSSVSATDASTPPTTRRVPVDSMVSHTIAIGAEPVPPHGVPAPPTELSPEEADAFVAALPTDQRLIFLFDSLPPGDLRSRVGFRIQDLTLTDPAPALSLFFRTSDPEIWGPLSYALSRSADASVVDAMVDLFTSGQQSRQRANADAVLSNISNPAAAPRLMAQFDLVGESTTHR